MDRTVERKLSRVDDALQKLTDKRKRSTDPVLIMDMSENIDRRLDERLTLMRARDGEPRQNGEGAG